MEDYFHNFMWSLAMKISEIFSRAPFRSKLAKEMLCSGYLGKGSRAMDKKQYEIARNYFEKIIELDSSERSNGYAYENLGMLFENGLGVKKDVLLAEEYYLRAGSRGNRAYLHKVAIKSSVDKTYKNV